MTRIFRRAVTNRARNPATQELEMDTYENRLFDSGDPGADAIVCMRFTTSPVMQGCAELLAYGTAVKIRRRELAL